MRFKILYFLVTFLQLLVLISARAQDFDYARKQEFKNNHDIFNHQSAFIEDSSSTKISIIPIVALGLGGLIAGGIIGEHIDSGGPFEITKAEKIGMAIGSAVGVTTGYVLAKKGQKAKKNKGK